MQTVFLRQVVLHCGRFVFGEDAVIDQYFADFPIEECVVDALSDGACAAFTGEDREFTSFSEDAQAVDIERVDVIIVHGAGRSEILPDAARRPGVEEVVSFSRRTKAR